LRPTYVGVASNDYPQIIQEGVEFSKLLFYLVKYFFFNPCRVSCSESRMSLATCNERNFHNFFIIIK